MKIDIKIEFEIKIEIEIEIKIETKIRIEIKINVEIEIEFKIRIEIKIKIKIKIKICDKNANHILNILFVLIELILICYLQLYYQDDDESLADDDSLVDGFDALVIGSTSAGYFSSLSKSPIFYFIFGYFLFLIHQF